MFYIMKEKRNRLKKIIILILFITSIILFSLGYYYFAEHNKSIKEIQEANDKSVIAFFEKDKSEKIIKNDNSITKYMAVLEIPTIGLKQGIPEINSSDNNVEKNIMVIKSSMLPNDNNGVFILAAHSGNSAISYFKNLYKIKEHENIYVYYGNYKYNYELSNIYTIEKNGTLQIKRNPKKTTLILVTCTKNSDTKQTVYVAYLKDKLKY